MSRQRFLTRLAALVAVAALTAPSTLAQGPSFSRYVALGDSLTAAFMSGGLLDEVQRSSYPALINTQAGGRADFQQPLAGTPGIPALLDLVSLRPLVILPRSSTNGLPLNLNLARPYDNLAVPGFRVRDVLANPSGNALVNLILRPPAFGNASALQQALLLQPTFVTLWIGNNDVLGAATSGIVIDGVTLTPVAQFDQQLRAIVGPLRAAGANMAIANVPNVTGIPFVTTLPPVVVSPTTQQPVLINGRPVPLIGPNGPLAPTDRVLLTATTPLSMGIGIPASLGGTGLPLGTQFFLDGNELALLNSRVMAYNNVIRQVASDAGAALVDMNAMFNEIAAEGLDLLGIEYSSAFLTGGIFSYDGVHPTPFGYAFVANEFIKAINERFDTDIEEVDLFRFTFGSDASAGTFSGSAAVAKDFVFSEAAYESLRRSLRTPPTERLLEILRQRGQDEGPTGGPGPTPDRPETPAKRPQRDRPGSDG